MRKAWIWTAGAALLLLGAVWLASPIFAARALVNAARAGDEAALEQRVDFPAFRDSLKSELNDRLVAEMRQELGARSSALGGLGMLLAPMVVDGAVDALVTPSAIASMVRTAEAPQADAKGSDRTWTGQDPQGRDGTASQPSDSSIRQSYGYRDLNTFALTLTDDDRPERRVELLMDRRGLFDWKLAAIDLSERE